MNKKIKAFTMNELVVVLIITVIIVGIAFSVLRLISLQLTSISSFYNDKNELLLFDQQLQYDIDSALKLYYDDKEERLLVFQEGDTIQYDFSAKEINRGDMRYPFVIKESTFYHQGKEVINGNIDALQLDVILGKVTVSMFANINKSSVSELSD